VPADQADPVIRGDASAKPPSFSVDSHNVTVETIKRSEDGKTIVVRLFEQFGGHAKTTLKM
jgi:alpha-mannosidase